MRCLSFCRASLFLFTRAWFDVIFKEYQDKKATVYRSDAYSVLTGYTVYDCEEAYQNGQWLNALKKMKIAVQVDWAQTVTGTTDRAYALMDVTLFGPNENKTVLNRKQKIKTNQGAFLRFLLSGDLAELEA